VRRFAALLRVRTAQPAQALDLADLATTWPRSLTVRLLAALSVESAVASFLAVQNRLAAAQVGQLLRAAGLDEATDKRVFRQLKALYDVNPARASTLRRDMEWEDRDAVFFPAERLAYGDESLAVRLALLADEVWEELPLPCTHRLPAPSENPDAWPETSIALLPVPLPDSWAETLIDLSSDPLRAGIEWLHLWRRDATVADEIRAAIPTKLSDGWIAALLAATDPLATAPLPYDLVLLEHLWEDHSDFLSQIEVDALLRGVSDAPVEIDFCDYDEKGRGLVHKAVLAWLKRAGGAK
jgi:hypothetical protein